MFFDLVFFCFQIYLENFAAKILVEMPNNNNFTGFLENMQH